MGREVLGEAKEADRSSHWTWQTRMRKGIECSCGLYVGGNMIFFFFAAVLHSIQGFLAAQTVTNLPAMWETRV